MRLMSRIRESIKNNCFPEFVKKFVRNYYSNEKNHETLKKKSNENEEIETNNSTQQTAGSDQVDNHIPQWVVNALNAVNINVLEN